jgi:hypothetical protein
MQSYVWRWERDLEGNKTEEVKADGRCMQSAPWTECGAEANSAEVMAKSLLCVVLESVSPCRVHV